MLHSQLYALLRLNAGMVGVFDLPHLGHRIRSLNEFRRRTATGKYHVLHVRTPPQGRQYPLQIEISEFKAQY